MATDIYYFKGKCKWAKVLEPAATYDKRGEEWSISMYLDPESWAQFEESGLELKVRTDDNNEKFVNFKRPTKKLIKGELREYTPPLVIDDEGNNINELIGNDSLVTCKVSVYDTMKGKGHTFEGIRVHEHVKLGQVIEHVEDGVVPF